MGPAVAMGSDVNDAGAWLHIDLVDTEQEQHIERAGFEHRAGIQSALARHETEIERAGKRGLVMQNVEAVPAVLDDAERERGRHG